MSVVATSSSRDAALARRGRLVGFVSRLRRRQSGHAAAAAAMHAALLGAVPAVLVAWFLPRHGLLAGCAVVGLSAVAGAIGAFRQRRLSAARLFAATPPAAGLTRLRDGLATWLEKEAESAADSTGSASGLRSSQPVMTEWLADELDTAIADLPKATVAAVGRRRLGRWRWVVPVLIALLIAWLWSLLWQPPWPGLLGGRPDRPDGSSGAVASGVGGGTGSGDRSVGDGAKDESPEEPGSEGTPPPDSPRPGPEDPQPEEPAPVAPPPSEPPAPLLDLPKQQLFAVPKFVGEGPTTRVRAHVAEVPVGGQPKPTDKASTGGGERAVVPEPAPRAVDFDRAAERARAARHVPPAERAIVRRFFELLREAAK